MFKRSLVSTVWILAVCLLMTMIQPIVAAESLPDGIASEPGEISEYVAELPDMPESPYYGFKSGIIQNVRVRDGVVEIIVRGSEGEYDIFIVTGETFLYKVNIAKGEEIIGFYRSRDVVTLQYPTSYRMEIICSQPTGTVAIKGDLFTVSEEYKALLSSDGSMILSIGEHTQVRDVYGNMYRGGSLADKPLLVFYDESAQGNPTKITPDTIVVVEKREPMLVPVDK